MGFERRLITAAHVDDIYDCLLCKKVLDNAVSCKQGHLFCSLCITSHLATTASCPIDQEPFCEEDLTPVPLVISRHLEKFEIRCEFSTFGCTVITKLAQATHHLLACDFRSGAVKKLEEDLKRKDDRVRDLEHDLMTCR